MSERGKLRVKQLQADKVFNVPEASLWASVLELAIVDYAAGLESGSHTDTFTSAKRWIFGENQSGMNSFDTICMMFNLDPDHTRRVIKTNPYAIKARFTGKKEFVEESCTPTELLTTTSS